MLLDDQFQSEEPSITPLSDREIFTQIWSQPRKVVRYINSVQYEKYLTPLVAIIGISNAFDNAISRNMGDDLPLAAILGVCIIVGGLLGWISTYIYASLLRWTGSWLEGKAATQQIFRTIGYCSLPIIVGLALMIPQILVFGVGLFQSDLGDYSGSFFQNVILFGSGFLEVALAIWSFILLLVGLSEIQGFSLGKSFLNMLLPILIIVVPLVILYSLFIGI